MVDLGTWIKGLSRANDDCAGDESVSRHIFG